MNGNRRLRAAFGRAVLVAFELMTVLQGGGCQRTPRSEVEALAGREHMQTNVGHGKHTTAAFLGNVRLCNAGAVDDVNRAVADHIEAVAADDDGGILIDANPENPRVLGHRAEQPANSAAFGEVLVD